MKKIVLILSLITNSLFGQEMFNNGGFENYYNCPTGWDQALQIIGCSARNSTPEYYNCTYGASNAYSGTGSVYLGAIRNGTSSFTEEGINLQLTTALTAGTSYTVAVKVRYGATVYGDPGFDYSNPLTCFNLRFVFANANQFGRPNVYHAELDGGLEYGNDNTSYHQYSFTFTPTQNYTHLYIITASADNNAPGTTNASCTSIGSLAYVYYNYIDDLSIQPVSLLPVKLVDFNGVQLDESIKLNWTTASEINNDLFEIQRSINALDWETIGEIHGAGNSSSETRYSYIDNYPKSAVSYYRLKQIDYNGKGVYSEKLKINYRIDLKTVIFPNPNNGEFTFIISGDNESETKLIIRSSSGQVIYNQDIMEKETIIVLDNQPAGMYYYTVINSRGVTTERFIVK